jgi:hypothetical protein
MSCLRSRRVESGKETALLVIKMNPWLKFKAVSRRYCTGEKTASLNLYQGVGKNCTK